MSDFNDTGRRDLQRIKELEDTIASFAAVDAVRQEENAKLQTENKELREAARAVVESRGANQLGFYEVDAEFVCALAALLEKN